MSELEEENPFERYGLDPTAGPKAITARLRELAEDAEDELERARIREAWEALTMHPRRRLDLALQAHPESRAPLGRPPRPLRLRAEGALALADLVPLPPLAEVLGVADVTASDSRLQDDPILAPNQREDR